MSSTNTPGDREALVEMLATYDYSPHPDYMMKVGAQKALAILAALDAAGLVIVPREPTLEMLADGHYAASQVRRTGVSGMTIDAQTRAESVRENAAYRAMLIASPFHPDSKRES